MVTNYGKILHYNPKSITTINPFEETFCYNNYIKVNFLIPLDYIMIIKKMLCIYTNEQNICNDNSTLTHRDDILVLKNNGDVFENLHTLLTLLTLLFTIKDTVSDKKYLPEYMKNVIKENRELNEQINRYNKNRKWDIYFLSIFIFYIFRDIFFYIINYTL